MRDDSFVVEAIVKNVLKNYGNHKWIKMKVFDSFFLLLAGRRVGIRENFAMNKFLRWSWLKIQLPLHGIVEVVGKHYVAE